MSEWVSLFESIQCHSQGMCLRLHLRLPVPYICIRA